MNEIKIFNWNVNGLRAILKKNIIDNVSFEEFIKKNNYTMIALQEVKLSENNKDILDNILPQYPYRYSSLTHNSRSGVVVFSKIKAKKVIYNLNKKDLRYKGRGITLEFDKFYYTNVYQPNSGEHLKNIEFRTNEWDPIFRNLMLRLAKKKTMIISGDMNVVENIFGTWNYKQHLNKLAGVTEREMNNFQLLLKNFVIVKTNGNFTYFSYRFKAREYNKGMAIDHFLISKSDVLIKNKINIEILDKVYGSDHIPLVLKIIL